MVSLSVLLLISCWASLINQCNLTSAATATVWLVREISGVLSTLSHLQLMR